eukprot:m.919431 g.919431  ORF g.919431 m.919431 type:complete len:943 (-) comp23752_c0_seq2:103-2931(-)
MDDDDSDIEFFDATDGDEEVPSAGSSVCVPRELATHVSPALSTQSTTPTSEPPRPPTPNLKKKSFLESLSPTFDRSVQPSQQRVNSVTDKESDNQESKDRDLTNAATLDGAQRSSDTHLAQIPLPDATKTGTSSGKSESDLRPSLFSLATLTRTVGELRATTSQKLHSLRQPSADAVPSNAPDTSQPAPKEQHGASPNAAGNSLSANSSSSTVASFANMFSKRLSTLGSTTFSGKESQKLPPSATETSGKAAPIVADSSKAAVPQQRESSPSSLAGLLYAKGIDVVSSVSAFYPSKSTTGSFSSTVAALPAKISTVASFSESMKETTATQAPQSTPELVSSYPTKAMVNPTAAPAGSSGNENLYPSRTPCTGHATTFGSAEFLDLELHHILPTWEQVSPTFLNRKHLAFTSHSKVEYRVASTSAAVVEQGVEDSTSGDATDMESAPVLWSTATLSVFIQPVVDAKPKTAPTAVAWLVCGPWALKLTRDVHVRRYGRSYVLSNAIGTSEFFPYAGVAADVADLLEQQVPAANVVTNIVITMATNLSKDAVVYLDRLIARYSAVQVVTDLQGTLAPSHRGWGHALAKNIESGTAFVSDTVTGATMVGRELIGTGGNMLRQRLPRNETPTAVSPRTKYVVGKAGEAAGHLSVAGSTITGTVKRGVDTVANTLAPTVVGAVDQGARGKEGSNGRGGTKEGGDASWVSGDDEDGTSTKHQLLAVGKAGVGAALKLLGTVDSATTALVSEVGKQTTDTVRHRHGDEAAGVTSQVLTAAGTTLTTYRGVTGLGVKSVSKQVAKKTASNIITDVDRKDKPNAVSYSDVKDDTDEGDESEDELVVVPTRSEIMSQFESHNSVTAVVPSDATHEETVVAAPSEDALKEPSKATSVANTHGKRPYSIPPARTTRSEAVMSPEARTGRESSIRPVTVSAAEKPPTAPVPAFDLD